MTHKRNLIFILAVALAGLCTTQAMAASAEEKPVIERLAERGNDGAQVILAGMYQRGEGGLPQDEQAAARWFEKAAVQGNAYAQMQLGDLYDQGRGVPQSAVTAADWREKAANRGNVRAQALLGEMYLNGKGVAKDLRKAEFWLSRAAIEGGSAQAQYQLARMHLQGQAGSPNPRLAYRLLNRAAVLGHAEATELLHLIEELGYHLDETLHQGSAHLHKLARDGDPEAQYQLGLRLENAPLGSQVDHRNAVAWFERAAGGGHVKAMRSLAHIYANGLDGVPANADKAGYWQRQARQRAAAPPLSH